MNHNFNLSMLNWNVRGLGDLQKCAVIKDLAVEAKPDLICYQDTKWSECSIFQVRHACPSKFKHYIALDAYFGANAQPKNLP